MAKYYPRIVLDFCVFLEEELIEKKSYLDKIYYKINRVFLHKPLQVIGKLARYKRKQTTSHLKIIIVAAKLFYMFASELSTIGV